MCIRFTNQCKFPDRGLFHLTRKKDWKLELERRLKAAGIEIKMTDEGEMDLAHVPEGAYFLLLNILHFKSVTVYLTENYYDFSDIVSEFTSAIQTEISRMKLHYYAYFRLICMFKSIVFQSILVRY